MATTKPVPPPPPTGKKVSPPGAPVGLKAPPASPPTRGAKVVSVQKKQPRKTFTTEEWGSGNEGHKILLYADSGLGKTTLASMLPSPRFIGSDDGGRKIRHPVTGEKLKHVPGVETFQDVRDAVTQPGLFENDETVVIDTATIVQDWAEEWVLANIKPEKGDHVGSLQKYGWGAGYRHLYETMHLLLPDLDPLVQQGKNVVLICQLQQTSISNPGGEDFLKDVPKLQNQYGKVCPSVWGLYTEWADHVLKIEYEGITATKKKAASSGSRVVRIHPEIHFIAKSRTIPATIPTIYFSEPSDDSVWRYLFDEVWRTEDADE